MTRFSSKREDRSVHDVTCPSLQSLNVAWQVTATVTKSEDCSVHYHIFPKTEYARPLFDASTDAALIAGENILDRLLLKALTTLPHSCVEMISPPSQIGIISKLRTLAGM